MFVGVFVLLCVDLYGNWGGCVDLLLGGGVRYVEW